MDQGQIQAPGDFIPTNIVNAAAKVENYYLLESSIGPLAKEFFDLEHVKAFSSVGLKSALHDSVVWVIGYVLCGGVVHFIQDNYLAAQTMMIFGWTVNASPFFWFTKMASFGFLATSTGCCVYMSQFYIGVVCKKAINTVFTSRALFLIVFSFLTFLALGILHKYVFNDIDILDACRLVYRIHPDFAERLYRFLAGYFRRSLFESAIVSLVASLLSILLPFLTALYFRYRKRSKKVLGIEVR